MFVIEFDTSVSINLIKFKFDISNTQINLII